MKIVITGNYGAENLGDEMILKGLLCTIRKIVPFAELTVLSGNPRETARNYQVNSAEKFPAGFRSLFRAVFGKNRETAKVVKECDYFILGGGGLFGGLKKRANIIWGIQAVMAYFYRKPVIMCGQSVGNLGSWFEKRLIKKIFSKARLIIVRDEKSKDRLEKLGVKKKIHVYPDLAFGCKVEDMASQRQNKLLVALREMDGISQSLKQSVAEFLNWLINEHKWNVTFVTFQKGVGTDDPLHEEVMEMIVDKSYMDLINELDIEKVIKAFTEAEMILGMRLHSIISAIKAQTPFIAINYAPKVADLLENSGFEENIVEMNMINPETLRKQFEKIRAEKEKITGKLNKYNAEIEKKRAEMEELLKATLK
ncbi:MAG: polysaccharide pyruvyl transferase family protein [Candidatus Gracilibacteria bacterium]|jgi:polysaccharide pyruvyl transferase CsaB